MAALVKDEMIIELFYLMFTKTVFLKLCSVERWYTINKSQEWKNNSDFYRSHMTIIAVADNEASFSFSF